MKKLFKNFRRKLINRKLSIIMNELVETLKFDILFEPNDHYTRNKAMNNAVDFLKSKNCVEPTVMIVESKHSKTGVDIHTNFTYKGESYFNQISMDRTEN